MKEQLPREAIQVMEIPGSSHSKLKQVSKMAKVRFFIHCTNFPVIITF